MLDAKINNVNKCDLSQQTAARIYRQVYNDVSIVQTLCDDRIMVLDNEKLCVPRGMIEKIINVHHRSHTSGDSLNSTIKKGYYWPDMTMHINHFCEKCEGCRVYKPLQIKDPFVEETHVDISTLEAMEQVGTDFFYLSGAAHLV